MAAGVCGAGLLKIVPENNVCAGRVSSAAGHGAHALHLRDFEPARRTVGKLQRVRRFYVAGVRQADLAQLFGLAVLQNGFARLGLVVERKTDQVARFFAHRKQCGIRWAFLQHAFHRFFRGLGVGGGGNGAGQQGGGQGKGCFFHHGGGVVGIGTTVHCSHCATACRSVSSTASCQSVGCTMRTCGSQ